MLYKGWNLVLAHKINIHLVLFESHTGNTAQLEAQAKVLSQQMHMASMGNCVYSLYMLKGCFMPCWINISHIHLF